jgi:hypothetical protein
MPELTSFHTLNQLIYGLLFAGGIAVIRYALKRYSGNKDGELSTFDKYINDSIIANKACYIEAREQDIFYRLFKIKANRELRTTIQNAIGLGIITIFEVRDVYGFFHVDKKTKFGFSINMPTHEIVFYWYSMACTSFLLIFGGVLIMFAHVISEGIATKSVALAALGIFMICMAVIISVQTYGFRRAKYIQAWLTEHQGINTSQGCIANIPPNDTAQTNTTQPELPPALPTPPVLPAS